MDPSSHSLVLLQQLNMQREFGYLCDCTVAIGDVYFKAHRAVLAAFSNYFKMIFIHQSSECIKIQPTDIQPDIFSYLLHVMYTGKRPKQPVDATRLENGIRFLHANLLSQPASEPIQVLTSESIHSNLYGIQISTTQKTPKETIKLRDKSSSTLRQSPPGEHPQLQLSLAIGLEGVGQDQQRPPFTGQEGAAGKTLEEIQKTTMSIKQETCESDYMKSPPQSLTSSEDTESTFSKAGNRVYSCHYCGDHFESRLSLRDHLHIHVSQSLPFGVPASILESDDLGEVRPLLENLESAENYRLGNYLLNRSEEPSQHASHQEQLQLSQLSFLSKDADPIELNCNFSFLRKRKLSCTFCGHRFLRRGQLLEHLYTHKIKPHKYNHHPKCGNPVDQPLSTYGNSLTEIIQKGPDSPPDHLEFPVELEPSIQQEHVEAVLVE